MSDIFMSNVVFMTFNFFMEGRVSHVLKSMTLASIISSLQLSDISTYQVSIIILPTFSYYIQSTDKLL